MADLAELELRVSSLEVERASSRLKELARTGTETEAKIDRLDRRFNTLSSTITRVRVLGSFLAASFIATRVANNALISTLAEYETSLVTLRAVAIDSTQALATQEEQFNSLDEAAREVGRTTSFSAVEAAEGLVTLAKAGLTAQESIDSLTAVLALSQGQLIAVDTAAEIVTNVLRQFGIAASDSSRVVDVLSETANRTSTDVTNLGTALKFVGPIASTLGQELEQVTGALGALANSGIQGSLAGTTLRGVLTALSGPTDIAKKAINAMKLSVEELDPAVNSIEDIVGKLAGVFLGTVEAVDIFNKRNAATALVLTNNIRPLRELIKQQEEARGQTIRLARAQEDTLAGAFKRLRATYKDVILEQTALSKSIRDLTDFLTAVVGQFGSAEKSIERTNEAAVNFVNTLKLVALALSLGVIVKTLVDLLRLKAAFDAVSGSVTLLTAASRVNPFFILLSGATALFFALQKLNPELVTSEERVDAINKKAAQRELGALAESLARLDVDLEDAIKTGDVNKQLELTASKISNLKTLASDVRFNIKNDPAAGRSVELFNKLIDETIKDPELNIKVKTQAARAATLELANTIKAELAAAVQDGTKVDLAVERATAPGQGFINKRASSSKLDDAISGVFSSQVEEKIKEQIILEPEDYAKAEEALKKHLLNNVVLVGDSAEVIAQKQKATFAFISELTDNLINNGQLLTFPDTTAFGDGASVLTGIIDGLEEDQARLSELAKQGFESFFPSLTQEEIDSLAEYSSETEKAQKKLQDYLKTHQQEQQVLKESAGLSDLEVQALRDKYEALEVLTEAKEQANEAFAFDLGRLNLGLEGARKFPKEAEESGRTEEAIQAAIDRTTKSQAELNAKLEAEIAIINQSIEGNLELAKARKEAQDAAKTAESVRETALGNLQSLRAENTATKTRIAVMQESNAAARASIQVDAEQAAFIESLVAAKRDEALTSQDIVDQTIAEYEAKKLLLAQEEKLGANRKSNIKDAKAESEAIRDIVQDLNLEIQSIGKTSVEKEALNRVRRLSSGFIEAESESEQELVKSVKVVVQQLDQSRKAEQLGRNLARAFSDPIKDILKGGSIEDAARSLLERLFDIFLEVTIFQPLEEKFAQIFSKNKGAQKIVAGSDYVDEEQVEKANATINSLAEEVYNKLNTGGEAAKEHIVSGAETANNKLTLASDGLDLAFEAGVSTADALIVAAERFRGAFEYAAGIKFGANKSATQEAVLSGITETSNAVIPETNEPLDLPFQASLSSQITAGREDPSTSFRASTSQKERTNQFSTPRNQAGINAFSIEKIVTEETKKRESILTKERLKQFQTKEVERFRNTTPPKSELGIPTNDGRFGARVNDGRFGVERILPPGTLRNRRLLEQVSAQREALRQERLGVPQRPAPTVTGLAGIQALQNKRGPTVKESVIQVPPSIGLVGRNVDSVLNTPVRQAEKALGVNRPLRTEINPALAKNPFSREQIEKSFGQTRSQPLPTVRALNGVQALQAKSAAVGKESTIQVPPSIGLVGRDVRGLINTPVRQAEKALGVNRPVKVEIGPGKIEKSLELIQKEQREQILKENKTRTEQLVKRTAVRENDRLGVSREEAVDLKNLQRGTPIGRQAGLRSGTAPDVSLIGRDLGPTPNELLKKIEQSKEIQEKESVRTEEFTRRNRVAEETTVIRNTEANKLEKESVRDIEDKELTISKASIDDLEGAITRSFSKQAKQSTEKDVVRTEEFTSSSRLEQDIIERDNEAIQIEKSENKDLRPTELVISRASINELEQAIRRALSSGSPAITSGSSLQSQAQLIDPATVSQLSVASAQMANAFSPLPITTANMVQAAANMNQAAPVAAEASAEIEQSTSTATQNITFTGEFAKGLFGQAAGFLQSILSGKLGFGVPLPFKQGGVFNSTSHATTFADGGVFVNNTANSRNSTSIVRAFATGGVFENTTVSSRNSVTNSQAFANGGAFISNSIDSRKSIMNSQAFAAGGTFTNKVVNKPTYFDMGLMGEAGPEAIMPLKQVAGGRLAVTGYIGSKAVAQLQLARGPGGRLGVDMASLKGGSANASRFAMGEAFDREDGSVGSARAFALGAPIASGRVIDAPQPFALGSVFGPSSIKQLEVPEMGKSPITSTGGSEAQAAENTQNKNITFNSTYVFGNNVTPDKAFRRSAKQHEDDLRNSTRRIF